MDVWYYADNTIVLQQEYAVLEYASPAEVQNVMHRQCDAEVSLIVGEGASKRGWAQWCHLVGSWRELHPLHEERRYRRYIHVYQVIQYYRFEQITWSPTTSQAVYLKPSPYSQEIALTLRPVRTTGDSRAFRGALHDGVLFITDPGYVPASVEK